MKRMAMLSMGMCLLLLWGSGTAFGVRKHTSSVRKNSLSSGKKITKNIVKINSANAENTLDTMDTAIGWDSYADNGVTTKLGSLTGVSGQALEIAYDFGSGKWWGVSKTINKSFAGAKGLRFVYRGEGNANTLEIKLEDANGTNFGTLVAAKTNPGSWTTIEIPSSNFTYWWGDNRSLDWTNIKNFHFAGSIKDTDEGGSGKVVIDQLELLK